MFNRSIILNLFSWAESNDRKPILLPGARQVGKTSIVRDRAGRKFKHFVEINLEDRDVLKLFQHELGLKEFLDVVRVYLKHEVEKDGTMLFID